jgi:DNA repair protein SbcD/Mre11
MKPPLRILHTADLHLGAKFVQLGAKGRIQRERLRLTLADIAEVAVQRQVHLVLIAGDLFDSAAPSPESQDALRQAVARLASAGIRCLLIAGTHDAWDRGTLLARLAAEYPNQLIVFSPQQTRWQDPELQVTVQGISLRQADDPKRPITLLQRTDAPGWQLGMAHAALELGANAPREAVFSPAEVAATRLDYLALGHWHRQRDCSSGKTVCWYPGSPELIALDEEEAGTVLLVTLQEGKSPAVEPIPVGKRRVLRLAAEGHDPAAVLRLAGARRDLEAILDLTLTGIVTPSAMPDLDALRKTLEQDFFFVRLQNAMQAEFSPEALAAYSENTVIGRFVRLAEERKRSTEPGQRAELEEALQLGLSWLSGREVAPWS